MGLDFDAIRRRKRGQPTGKEVFDRELVVCPSWSEVEKLESNTILPVHVDEAQMMAETPLLVEEDKKFILELKTLAQGVRLIKIQENKRGNNE